jgi:hypothetical protein
MSTVLRLALCGGIAWLGFKWISGLRAAQGGSLKRTAHDVDLASEDSFPASDPPPFSRAEA